MTTTSNISRATASPTNVTLGKALRTWDSTTSSWDTTPGTWDSDPEQVTNISRNTTTPTNQAAN